MKDRCPACFERLRVSPEVHAAVCSATHRPAPRPKVEPRPVDRDEPDDGPPLRAPLDPVRLEARRAGARRRSARYRARHGSGYQPPTTEAEREAARLDSQAKRERRKARAAADPGLAEHERALARERKERWRARQATIS